MLYVEGRGVAKGLAPAALWMERACTGNDAIGCRLYGAMLIDGAGVAQDEKRGRQLIGKACASGDAAACQLGESRGWILRGDAGAVDAGGGGAP